MLTEFHNVKSVNRVHTMHPHTTTIQYEVSKTKGEQVNLEIKEERGKERMQCNFPQSAAA